MVSILVPRAGDYVTGASAHRYICSFFVFTYFSRSFSSNTNSDNNNNNGNNKRLREKKLSVGNCVDFFVQERCRRSFHFFSSI
jgi:hypothetical protein